ncbi:MAG: helix-hairpin-helix domain-containing protein [Candidatus Sericytochromatia bacterium]|nr:helix-hairpin-helix domain-containing protein [Candidatus Sericytochromatia bacterium]
MSGWSVLLVLLAPHLLDARLHVTLETPGRSPRLVQEIQGARVQDVLRRTRTHVPPGWRIEPPLAAALRDGMAIRLSPPAPRRPTKVPRPRRAVRSFSRSSSPSPLSPVDLNHADAAALDRLPGIGPSLARAILERRRARGGSFRSLADLEGIKGLGPRRIERLGPLVRFR